MLVTAGPEKREPELPASPADSFSPQRYPCISDIKYQPPIVQGLPDLPVFTFSLASIGILLVFSGLFGTLAQTPVPTAGLLVLALALPSYLIEKALLWRALRLRAESLKPCVDELKILRDEIGAYLAGLDRRTMKYFHCVTNSKVTTYFMLRQIENSLAEQFVEYERLFGSTSQTNLFRIQEKLRGTLEYRDGFSFNSGKILHCPVHLLPARVQELVYDLERGITALESEIKSYREQVSGASAESERQMDLPLAEDETES